MEKKNLRTQQKMADVWSDGYLTLSNLRELNVRTLRNELECMADAAGEAVREDCHRDDLRGAAWSGCTGRF